MKSEEGTTQGDHGAMAICALGLMSFLAWLSKEPNEGISASAFKQVPLADDLNA